MSIIRLLPPFVTICIIIAMRQMTFLLVPMPAELPHKPHLEDGDRLRPGSPLDGVAGVLQHHLHHVLRLLDGGIGDAIEGHDAEPARLPSLLVGAPFRVRVNDLQTHGAAG